MTDPLEQQAHFGRVLFGLLLVAGFLFLTASLVSYSPTEGPQGTLFPPPVTVQNFCGAPGAAVAAWGIGFCGVGVWSLWAIFLLAVIGYWRSEPRPLRILAMVGVMMILASISGGAAFWMTRTSAGPVIGPGGWLGAMVRHLLEGWFPPTGCWVMLMSLFVAGTILATDAVVIRFFLTVTGVQALSEIFLAPFHRMKRQKLPPIPGLNAPPPPPTEPVADVAVTKKTDRFSDEKVGENEPWGAAGTNTAATNANDTIAIDTDFTEISDEESEDAPHPVSPYELPSMAILSDNPPCDFVRLEESVRVMGSRLERAFADYGFAVRVVEMQSGPVLTLYEIELAKGLRLTKIRSVAADLEVVLKVPSVRIVAPIPGKNTVGVEIPNTDRQLVRLREVMEEGAEQIERMTIPVFLGKDVSGDPLIVDLTKLPHLLIAGRTGTGKSVCLNTIILSILMTRSPDEVRMLMIDPKMVELSPYKTVPHLIYPVVTDMKKAEAILGWAVAKMEERYAYLARAGARQLSEYNRWSPEQLRRRMQPESEEEWGRIPRKLPHLVIVADELADLMMVAGKDVEMHIIRLAQKSRAVGIHLVLATQKPTVDVITGLIKSNLPARIAFGVASRIDSQVVLDCKGAEQLLGNGDMLFLLPGTSQVIRGQGTFVSSDEMESVISEIATDRPNFDTELFNLGEEEMKPDRAAELLRTKDKFYVEAVELVIREGRGSTSFLQQRLGVGYGRAARMIDTMAAEGVVGPYNGSQARDVIMTLTEWEELNQAENDAAPPRVSVSTSKRAHFVVEPPPRKLPFETPSISDEDAATNATNEDAADDTEESAEAEFDQANEDENVAEPFEPDDYESAPLPWEEFEEEGDEEEGSDGTDEAKEEADSFDALKDESQDGSEEESNDDVKSEVFEALDESPDEEPYPATEELDESEGEIFVPIRPAKTNLRELARARRDGKKKLKKKKKRR